MMFSVPDAQDSLAASTVVAKLPTEQRFALIRSSVAKARILKRTIVKVKTFSTPKKETDKDIMPSWLTARMANFPQTPSPSTYSRQSCGLSSNAACARRRLKMKERRQRRKNALQQDDQSTQDIQS
jgi:hypothetical protein